MGTTEQETKVFDLGIWIDIRSCCGNWTQRSLKP